MNYTQNNKIAQVTEFTMIVGVDIGSEMNLPVYSTGGGRRSPERSFALPMTWAAFVASWTTWR